MVFRRREKRSWPRIVAEFLWPRGGWARAAQYVRHRLRRLPDSPNRIGRGIFAGVFASFTPFFGLHFVTAAAVARAMRGNMIAALLATFFGNPITFPIIAWASLRLGHWLLGTKYREDGADTLIRKFNHAASDLWNNFNALFTPERAHWHGLGKFYDDVFLPYLVGGIVPGVITATIAYYISLPLITAYQNRRKLTLKRKLTGLRSAAAKVRNPRQPDSG